MEVKKGNVCTETCHQWGNVRKIGTSTDKVENSKIFFFSPTDFKIGSINIKKVITVLEFLIGLKIYPDC